MAAPRPCSGRAATSGCLARCRHAGDWEAVHARVGRTITVSVTTISSASVWRARPRRSWRCQTLPRRIGAPVRFVLSDGASGQVPRASWRGHGDRSGDRARGSRPPCVARGDRLEVEDVALLESDLSGRALRPLLSLEDAVGARATHDFAEDSARDAQRHRARAARQGRRDCTCARACRRRRARRQRRRRRERDKGRGDSRGQPGEPLMRSARGSSGPGKWRSSMFARQIRGSPRWRSSPPSAAQPAAASAQTPTKPTDNYDELFQRYLHGGARARNQRRPRFRRWAWMNGLALDRRAQKRQRPGDHPRRREHYRQRHGRLERCPRTAVRSAAVPKLFGFEKKTAGFADPTALVAAKTATPISRVAGTTTRAGELTALITARVSDVLPNGDMVVEGVREIEINGDRQIVVLTGRRPRQRTSIRTTSCSPP